MAMSTAALPVIILLSLVTLQRLGELVYARRNTQRLLSAGAVEIGARHYPLLVLLHSSWLAWLWYVALRGDAVLQVWPMLAYIVMQGFRAWIMISLGRFWTTRILIPRNAPLVQHGPYRVIRHPNYLLVVFEIALLPLSLGQPIAALVFSVMNALVLAWRIHVEESSLTSRRQSNAVFR
jgi:methyltransferase